MRLGSLATSTRIVKDHGMNTMPPAFAVLVDTLLCSWDCCHFWRQRELRRRVDCKPKSDLLPPRPQLPPRPRRRLRASTFRKPTKGFREPGRFVATTGSGNFGKTNAEAGVGRIEQDQQSLVFLGDSITQGWGDDLKGASPGSRSPTEASAATRRAGCCSALQADVLSLKPTGVVLLMGTNDLEEGPSRRQLRRTSS